MIYAYINWIVWGVSVSICVCLFPHVRACSSSRVSHCQPMNFLWFLKDFADIAEIRNLLIALKWVFFFFFKLLTLNTSGVLRKIDGDKQEKAFTVNSRLLAFFPQRWLLQVSPWKYFKQQSILPYRLSVLHFSLII